MIDLRNTKVDARGWDNNEKRKFLDMVFTFRIDWPVEQDDKYVLANFYYVYENTIYKGILEEYFEGHEFKRLNKEEIFGLPNTFRKSRKSYEIQN